MPDRREFLQAAAVGALGTLAPRLAHAAPEKPLIVDTHQHLWNPVVLRPPWLNDAPEILGKRYHLEEYAQATAGERVRAVYMEVDVAADQLDAEAAEITAICKSGKHPTEAAVLGARPESESFAKYVEQFRGSPYVKGVRRVLHVPETPAGFCLQERFVENVRLLGRLGLSFDLCMRPFQLGDALTLTEKCPDTRFIVDHCGNADPKAFDRKLAGKEEPWHSADEWQRSMERLAKRPNTLCKISGVVARLPQGGDASHLAPIVNHCLDTFGPDRVVFGSDWPVCLLGAPLAKWIAMLRDIVSTRPAADQQKLWSDNALARYGLKAKVSS